LFVDFPDAPTPRYPGPAEIFKNSIPDAEKYLEAMSYGTLDLTFRPLLKWLRMPQSVSLLYGDFDLGMNKSDLGMAISRFSLVDDAIGLADPEFDFGDIDSVVVIATPEADSIKSGISQLSPDWDFYADGQTIGNVISLGSGGRSDWVSGLIAHELGHNLGLPDLYDESVEKDSEGNLPYEEVAGFVGAFGIMGGITNWSTANEMFAWSRWQLGWLRDTQVACITSFPTSVQLTPLAIPGGIKAVVVPLTETTALVVESRGRLGYDFRLRKEGVLIYKVDTSVPSGEGPIVVGSISKPPDASVLKEPGEVWNSDGYSVTFKEVTPEGDLVEITAP
jgi:M6 family metalloprotease-like protein